MAAINRGPFNALVDDDGTNTVGSVWNKTAIKDVLLDPIDTALAASGGATLPINLNTDVTGTLQAAQEPAHTGDVTNAAGSLALSIANNAVTAAKIAAGAITTSKITYPGISILTDGASVPLDASGRHEYYRLAAAGDRTLLAPTGMGAGQKIVIAHVASGGANRTLTLQTGVSGGFRFGADIPGLTATISGKTDYIGCIYNGNDARFDVVAYTKGF